jgi:hypothetical protein
MEIAPNLGSNCNSQFILTKTFYVATYFKILMELRMGQNLELPNKNHKKYSS